MKRASVAKVILAQLGQGTLAMLGAHTLIDHGDGVSFKFKGSKVFNYLKVTLDPSDTYILRFVKWGRAPKFGVKAEKEFAGIYADQMHELIEAETGLYTRL